MSSARHPESLMMSYAYEPGGAMGALKSPVYETSTYDFKSAEEGKAFFEKQFDRPGEQDTGQMVYSRLNNPNLKIFEERLKVWDGAEECAAFNSGMAAISTCLLEMLAPGDLLIYSNPLYGGTDHFIKEYLPKWGIDIMGFNSKQTPGEVRRQLEKSGKAHKLAMVYLETPANPTNALVDIEGFSALAKSYGKDVVVAVDNTFLGPLYQHPITLGADLVLYSATKYIGGHSDLVAGACLGPQWLIARIKELRTYLGGMASPHTCWLLTRSLETLKVRMDQQTQNARQLANYLKQHSKIEQVSYPGLLDEHDHHEFEIYKNQCLGPGAMLSFTVKGGERAAFRFLNQLQLVKLAVSLGSTESLAQHPATMTHAGVDDETKREYSITGNLIRFSVGLEHYEDLITDVAQSLSGIVEGAS